MTNLKLTKLALLPILLFVMTGSIFADTVTYRDEFDIVAYNNNYGSADFTGDWIETNDDDSPSSGKIDALNNALNFTKLNSASIDREFNAQNATKVTYSFYVFTGNLGTKGNGDDKDQLKAQCWDGLDWNDLINMGNSFAPTPGLTTSADFPSACRILNSKIRFISGNGNWGNNSKVEIDNMNLEVVFPLDTDGDGVPDDVDIDDDNDGILDNLEGIPIANNGSFEEPVANTATWTLIDASNVPFWNTNASDNLIEFWKSGFQGVPSYDGNQHIEMNANEVASLYQDIATTPGDIISWRIAHRGRSGVDEANVSVGAPGALTPVLTMSDGSSAWGVYSGLYTIPAGQTTTRISFDSVSAAGGNPSVGNFIDGYQLIVVKDDDGDGVINSHDLDSDNDGIPDNVEAQPTSGTPGYITPSNPFVDTNNNGLDDNYESALGGTDLIPPDGDGDGIPDFLDKDSDNDGYTDCEEGKNAHTCPVTSVQDNGMVDWAGNPGYSDPNGYVNEPNPDNGGQLQDEVKNNNEAAYREFLCGKNLTKLTHYQWKLISFPCDTGANGIQDLIGGTNGLGVYGTDWELWQQTGNDNWEVNATHKNTNKTKLQADSTVGPGKGYWIIIDAGGAGNEKNVTIDKTLTGLSPTSTVDASSVSISNPAFTQVHEYQLPKGGDVNDVKYMAGNPFPFAFHLSDVYFKHNASSENYHAMGDSVNNTYINSIVYIHDSSETGPVNGYNAVDPATPGFGGSIPAMTGFFIKIEPNSNDDFVNHFAYPLIMSNQP